MFKVTITNKQKNMSWEGQFETEKLANEWLQKQIGKPHRLPERTVLISDEYDQDDVLEVIQKEMQIGVDENEQPIMEMQDTHVRLRAQFTAEIVDLSKDQAYLEAQTTQNRKLEYPPIDEVVEALIEHIVEGRPQKLQEIQAQREAVKIKYPKQGAK